MDKNTICVHTGLYIDPATKGMNTPVFTSTSFAYLDESEQRYPRYFNIPNQKSVVQKLAALEQGEDGLIFSSGMAAISTTLMALMQKGDHAIIQSNIYGGTHYFITSEFERFGLSYTPVNNINDPAEFEQALQANTKLVYIETPSNPLLDITDIAAVARMADGLYTVIDNTFATPVNQNPIALGIDVVLHSGTKYLGGHSDICCGAAISSREIMDKIRHAALCFGGSLNAETCYLLERSLKTLALRVERHNDNAMQVARYLEQHPAVARVYYPGLESHPGHEIAKKQMRGFGGMLSFEPDPAQIDPIKLLKNFELIAPAMSLGGVESIVCTPATTSHVKLSAAERAAIGIKDELLRLSVGIESAADLIADLAQALGRLSK